MLTGNCFFELLRTDVAACRVNSPGVSSVDGLISGSYAADVEIPINPGHLSQDGLPLIDADTFSKLLAEVSLIHNLLCLTQTHNPACGLQALHKACFGSFKLPTALLWALESG